jgi:type II secretory pathway pseudopilin PulG
MTSGAAPKANGMTANPTRNSSGFTYVGLLAFVAFLGAASAAAVSAGAALQRRDVETELLFIGGQFRDAFKSYQEATPPGQRPYPASLEDLVRDRRVPGVRRHLRRIYVDPLTGSAEWGTVAAPGGGIAGVFSRAGGRPLKSAQFPPEFAQFEGKESYADWLFAYAPEAAPLAPAAPGLAPGRAKR